MRDLLGGKGANVAEMTRDRAARPRRASRSRPRRAWTTCAAATRSRGPGRRGGRAPRPARGARSASGSATPSDPLLVSVRSGASLDARDDGHGPQPRPQRRARRGAGGRGRATRASPRLLPPVHPDVRRRGRGGRRGAYFEDALDAPSTTAARRADVDLDADDLRELVAHVQGHLPLEHRARTSRRTRAPSSTAPSAPCSSRGTTARAATTAASTTSRRPRHRRQRACRWCSATSGDDSAHRRRLHPQPLDRRAGELFGEFLVNAQGEDVVAGIRTPRPLAELEEELPEAFAQLIATPWQLLERHYRDMQDVEFTIEHGHALHAADAQRQAQRPGHGADRRDLVSEGLVTGARGARAGSIPASSTSCCCPGSTRSAATTPLATRRQRLAGRRGRRGRLRRRRGRAARPGRRGGDPGARRDHAGRHPRDDRRRRAS